MDSLFPSRFPAVLNPSFGTTFGRTASPTVACHAPNISTLTDEDPAATDPNQGRVYSYEDPPSSSPTIDVLADDDPSQRKVCAYADPFSNAPPNEVLADHDPISISPLIGLLADDDPTENQVPGTLHSCFILFHIFIFMTYAFHFHPKCSASFLLL